MILAGKPSMHKPYQYIFASTMLICATLLPALAVQAASLESAYKAGDYQYAIYEAKNIIKKDPKNLVAHYYLANIYSRQGDYKQAFTHYAFCAEFGKGTKVGIYAETALKEMENKKAPALSVAGQNIQQAGKQEQSVDQLKIELLKEGSQKIEERRHKLQSDVDALKLVSDRESLKYLPESLRAQYKDTPPGYLTNLSDNPAINQYIDTRKRYQSQMDSLKAAAELEIAKINRSYLDKIDYIDQRSQASTPGNVRAGGGGPASSMRRNTPVRDYINYGTDQVVDSIPVEPPLTATPQKISTGHSKSSAKTSVSAKVKTTGNTGKNKNTRVK
jgi:tetratricopeptide (TPR) repeat protein